MRTLFEISNDLSTLADLLDEVDGDVTDDSTDMAIDEWLSELGSERDTKLDNYGALIKQFEGIAKVRTEEAKRIGALAKADSNNADRLKRRLKNFFEIQKLSKVETPRFKFALQNNGGARPVTLTEDAINHAEELPEHFRKVVYEPNLVNIRETLEALEVAEMDLATMQPLFTTTKEYANEVKAVSAADKTNVAKRAAWEKAYDLLQTAIARVKDQTDVIESLKAQTSFATLEQRGRHLRIK